MSNEELITFGELKTWDIFETETGDYYLKSELVDDFNAMLLTGKHVECFTFSEDDKVKKFK
jgi:hypothetical protein